MTRAPYSEPELRHYLSAVDRLPVLGREQELELARRHQAGEHEAGNALVEAHLRSVAIIARKFSGYGIPVSELVAEGNLGLLEAVRRFDPERGLRFITYARYWIRAYVLAFVLKHWSIVDMGTTSLQSKLFFRLQAERARLETELGASESTINQRLADQFNTSEDHVRASLERLRGRDASLDAPLITDGSTTFLDMLRDEQESQEELTAAAEMAHLVQDAVARLWPGLDERERLLVKERLLSGEDGQSLAALGRKLGVTRERVRQIEVALKEKLRCAIRVLSGEIARPIESCSQCQAAA